MNIKEQLDKLEISKEVTPGMGNLTLIWDGSIAGVELFHFQNQDSKPVDIPGDADYLAMFSQVAERVYQILDNKDLIYQCACSIEGSRFYFKEFSPEEKERFRYASIALSAALKKLPEQDYPGRISFSSVLSYVNTKEETFEKEAVKVAKILHGDNKEDWMLISDNKYDFIKTDVFVLDLQKLHSWGFQAVKPGGEIDSKRSLVRSVRPKPRGAIRNKKPNRS